MTMTTSNVTRKIRFAVLAAAPVSFCIAAPALAESRAGAEVSLGATVGSDPFLVGDSGAVVSGRLQVDPWVRLQDVQTEIELHGSLMMNQYVEDYGTETSALVGLRGSKILSPYVNVRAGIGYRTSENGLDPSLTSGRAPDSGLPPTTPLPDVSFGGTRTRTSGFDAFLGLGITASARDQIDASLTAARTTYDDPLASDYNFLNGGLTYARTLNDRTSLTASVRLGKTDYSGTRVNDGTIITPQLGVRHRFSQIVTLDASVGASFVDSNGLLGLSRKSTSFAGSLRLCREGERTSACLSADQTAQPTGSGGIRSVTAVSVNYDNRLSPRDTLSLSASYSANEENLQSLVTGAASDYYTASASLTRRFNQRLSGFVSPSCSRISDRSGSRNNFQVVAGLRFSIGAIS